MVTKKLNTNIPLKYEITFELKCTMKITSTIDKYDYAEIVVDDGIMISNAEMLEMAKQHGDVQIINEVKEKIEGMKNMGSRLVLSKPKHE